MRLRSILPFLTVVAIVIAGCGTKDPSTPIACREGAQAFISALKTAPQAVTLDDNGTRISGCLVENQPGGLLSEVGVGMTRAATLLNSEARSDPGGQANVALGYLVGAAQSGAEDTAGVHTELIRRLEGSGGYSPQGAPLSSAFKDAYNEGVKAGRESG